MAIENSLVMQHNLVQIETVSILIKSVIEEMIVITLKMNLIVFSWLIFRKGIDGLFAGQNFVQAVRKSPRNPF